MSARIPAPAGSGGAGWACTLHLERRPDMVRYVREVLRTLLGCRHTVDFTETACLLASEIVSNALVHTGTPVCVKLREIGSVLRLEARDRDVREPELNHPADSAEGGRGLVIVDACATRWGIDKSKDGRGKHVWFELEEAPASEDDQEPADSAGQATTVRELPRRSSRSHAESQRGSASLGVEAWSAPA